MEQEGHVIRVKRERNSLFLHVIDSQLIPDVLMSLVKDFNLQETSEEASV